MKLTKFQKVFINFLLEGVDALSKERLLNLERDWGGIMDENGNIKRPLKNRENEGITRKQD